MKDGVYLRLHIPIDGFDERQRARAVALGDRVEAKVAGWLAKGADPDRIMALVEGQLADA